MGHRTQDRHVLRAEYKELESHLEFSASWLELRRETLERRKAGLREARDLTWLNGTTGTPAERRRLHRAANSVGWSPDATKLVLKIERYERWCSKERWRRPQLADWRRLVDEAVPILRAASGSEAHVVKREREEIEAARQRDDQMLSRWSELRWLLRDELFPDVHSKQAG